MVDFKRVGAKRLLKLASILDVADAEARKKKQPTYDQRRTTHDCGAPACALGHWAAYKGPKKDWYFTPSGAGIRHVPSQSDGIGVGEYFFGVDRVEAQDLFGIYGCGEAKTAKQAAKYIRKFVANKK